MSFFIFFTIFTIVFVTLLYQSNKNNNNNLKQSLLVALLLALLGILFILVLTREEAGMVSAFRNEPLFELAKSPKNDTFSKMSHKKWIIVTSISLPTPQIVKLGQIPGWKLLVVADKKTPSNWTHPNVTLLNVEDQSLLGYAVLKHLPWNSYTRKIIGYLYAIDHGASIIYDTDDDNAPDDVAEFENSFDLIETEEKSGLILDGDSKLVQNPYSHFGQRSIWPRGFPLEEIGQEWNNSYKLCSRMKTPLIQQALVNGDPDVDAIFRLTRKKLHTPLDIQFDPNAPPVIYPKFVFAPFNSQNTIFHYDAFWTLMLPISVSFRVTDIWRGYWAQRLIWEIAGSSSSTLAFYSAHTTQRRNPHTYLRDFEEEDKLYKQSGALIKLLYEWKCPEEAQDLYSCMTHLTEQMAEQKFWSRVEVDLVLAWITDLKRIGYKIPKLKNSTFFSSPSLSDTYQNPVYFTGVQLPENNTPSKLKLRKLCNFTLTSPSITNRNVVNYPNILLVITFNHPLYSKIWLLDALYRPHFPNILYCGDILFFTQADLNRRISNVQENFSFSTISFVYANVSQGKFGYDCALRAIEMDYSQGITGYLLLSDDILLNFWNLKEYNPKVVWTSAPIDGVVACERCNPLVNLDSPEDAPVWKQWTVWNQTEGRDATRKAMAYIYSNEVRNSNPEINQFCANRQNFKFNSSIVMFGASDAFYLPRWTEGMFYEVGKILRRFVVFHEIAVSIALSGLSSPQDSVILSGMYLWNDERKHGMEKYYNINSSILHPVKLWEVLDGRNFSLKDEYCSNYVSQVVGMSYS